jgi:serine/threonine protein kinase
MGQEQDGFPVTSVREVHLLSEFARENHPNIVKLHYVVVGYKKDSIFLAFEYCKTDLANLVDFIITS